ncbi:MAG: UbiX family flavin prenyltransferase [Nitrososphaeraceae archaeon]|nr:UbiX family flavin prenyltransferase [Nitrososphaeraceae archaeon]
MRLILAITGGSGVIYGIKMLEILRSLEIETHLVISKWGEINVKIETNKTVEYVKSLATKCYDNDNMAAAISSGSFKMDGMAIVPCSMKTLSSIASGYEDSLISRSAGVCIKESRRLVIVPRETPLSKIHLDNMIKLVEIGVVILPATPGFYHKPKSIDELIIHIVGKVLDQFGIKHNIFRRWGAGDKVI